MKLHNDIKKIQSESRKRVFKAATPRQLHFDNVARDLGYADSNIAFKHLGKSFIEKAKINAPSIKVNNN